MKKILTTALAIVLFVGASQAQDKPRHERGGKFATELNLTAEQKASFQTLREAQKKEMETLKQNGEVSKEQRKAIHEKYKAQYDAILTPAQKEEMNKKREEWKAKGKEGKGKNFGKREGQSGNRGDFGQQEAFFKKELNLTTDQETRLKGIFQEFQTKSKDIRSNNNLSKEQKRTQMQSLAKQYMDQGKAVLNADQLKKLDEMKGKHKGKRSKSNV
jgi:Spy/CpxP family protein refolding chaperone